MHESAPSLQLIDSISSYETHPSTLWPCTFSFWWELWGKLVLLEFCFLPKLVCPRIPSNSSQRQFVHIVLVWKSLRSHPCEQAETQRGGGHRSAWRHGESLVVLCSIRNIGGSLWKSLGKWHPSSLSGFAYQVWIGKAISCLLDTTLHFGCLTPGECWCLRYTVCSSS